MAIHGGMFRRHLARLVLMAAILFGFVPMTAQPASASHASGSLTVIVNPTSSATAESVRVTVSYSVTGLQVGDDVRVGVDLVDPFLYALGFSPVLVSGGSVVDLPSPCVDGYGLDTTTPGRGCKTVVSTNLLAPGASGSVAGVFELEARTADGVIPSGSTWSIPARLTVEPSAGPIETVATGSATVALTAAPDPQLTKQVKTVAPAKDPQTGLIDGYNVTYEINLRNDGLFPLGFDSGGREYMAGTSSLVDPIPPGAQFVPTASGRVNTDPANWATTPAFQVVPSGGSVNGNFSIIDNSPTDVTISVDNALTRWGTGGDYLRTELTYWFADTGLPTNADNTVTLNWSGSPISRTAALQLGPVNARLQKGHFCYFSTAPEIRTAHQPTQGANTDCYATPGGTMVMAIQAWAYPAGSPAAGVPSGIFVQPRIVDRLPQEERLASGLVSVYSNPNSSTAQPRITSNTGQLNGWEVGYSLDANCDESTGTFLPGPIPPADVSLVRCLEFSHPGVPDTPSYWPIYEVELIDPADPAIDDLGEYLFTDDSVWLSGFNVTEVNNSAVSGSGYGGVVLRSTWWNSDGLTDAQKGVWLPGYTGTDPVVQIGDQLHYRIEGLGYRPGQVYSDQFSSLGWTNVRITDALRPELRLRTGTMTDLHFDELPEDDAGVPVQPVCSITFAGFDCVFPGHLPLVRPTSSSVDPGGPNEYALVIDAEVIGGISGQIIPNDAATFNDVEPYPTNGTLPYFDPAHPRDARPPGNSTKDVEIGGAVTLFLDKSAAQSSVLPGADVTYAIDFANTGSAATVGSYVYDFLGDADPACSTNRPMLAAPPVQTAGTPSAVLAYTTDPNPTPASAWQSTPPTPLSATTGLRWELASNVVPTPGYYSPTDPPGQFEVTVTAPNEPGTDACNRAQFAADTVDPATDRIGVAIEDPQPSIAIVKDAVASPIVLGGTAQFTISVTNTGNVDLFSVIVTDPLVPNCDLDVSAALGGPLAPGQTYSFASPCELTNVTGSFTNTATVTAEDALGTPVTATDDAEIVVSLPSVSIVKDAVQSPIGVGDDAQFTISVTNTGAVDLFSVIVTDPLVPNCDLDVSAALGGPLAPGQTYSFASPCELTNVSGSFTNTATVTAQDALGQVVTDDDDAAVEVLRPAIDIVKTPDVQTVRIGDQVGFSIAVTNIGDVALIDVDVTDPLVPACDLDVTAALGGPLQPGQTFNYGCVLPAATTSFTNVASVVGVGAVGSPVTDSDPAEVIVIDPSIEIVKTALTPTIHAGDTATFEISVTNTGDTTLTAVAVTDPLAPACTNIIGSLVVGQTQTYTCDLPLLGGSITNVASVIATASDGLPVGDADTAAVDVIDPSISIVKTTTTPVIANGAVATFDITVTNDGDDDLANVVVTDPATPDCDNTIGTLAVGASVTWTCQVAGVSASFTNVATVIGVDALGDPVTHSDDADVTVSNPAIDVTKTAVSSPLAVGATASFTISVTNTGDTDLVNVMVDDPMVGSCSRSIGLLPAGAAVTYTCDDVNVSTSYTNTVTAHGTDQIGQSVTDSDSAEIVVLHPGIEIIKSASPDHVEAGDAVEFTVTVTNTGDTDLVDVAVEDLLTPDCDRTIGDLAIGASTAYSCTVASLDDGFTNTATATGRDAVGQVVTDVDHATVIVDHPGIDITKVALEATVEQGASGTWMIEVTNTGDVALHDVDVVDPATPGCNAFVGTLSVGETRSYTCTLDDISGTYTNTATVIGVTPLDSQVTDADTAAITTRSTTPPPNMVPPAAPSPGPQSPTGTGFLPVTGAPTLRLLAVALASILIGAFVRRRAQRSGR